MSQAPPGDAIIGRRAELDRLRHLLSSGSRLVTVLGPPGMGKTRLALEYVRRLEVDARTGSNEPACYCELDDVESLNALCAKVANRLGTTPARRGKHSRARTLVEAVADTLALRGPLLLVLDNFEQLVASGTEALNAWLRAAPGLKCLVTSRERLRIDLETAFELPALSLPVSGSDAGEAEAVQLFVARVRAQNPGFHLDRAGAPIVARLVRQLDGIPLAIELAAARVGVLGLEELEARLRVNLDVLARGKRHASARQATMRGAVQWSWDLLEESEQSALMCCGVFRGGFTLQAAEAVLGSQSSNGSGPVLDLLHSLRDKSLVHGDGPSSRDPRFDLYAGIREFARERLERSDAFSAIHREHARYFIVQAMHAVGDVERSGSSHALSWLVAERSNLFLAHEHQWALCRDTPAASASSAIEGAAEALLALEPVLMAHGPVEWLVESLTAVLSHPSANALTPVLRARALRSRAKAIQLQGSLDSVERDLDEALALAQAAGDRALSASIFTEIGILHHRLRRVERARQHYHSALDVYRELGDLRQQARTLGNLGALHHDVTDFAGADAHYEEALVRFGRLDEPRWEGIFMTNRGILEQEQGRFASARRHYERAMARLQHADDKRLLGITLGNLGVLEHESGNFEAAHAHHLRALDELKQVGDTHSEALCLARLGATHALLGESEEARARLVNAERLLGTFNDPVVSAAVRLNHAFLDLSAGALSEEHALDKIRAHMSAARSSLSEDGRSAADVSDDVRSTLRILERILAQNEPLFVSLKQLPREALVVGPEASWFRPPDGSLEDMRKHGAARRILQAFLEQRLSPSAPELSMVDLRDAGWPGERIDYHSGVNRVHVVLADLRKRGLRPWLKRSGRGYQLDAGLQVEVVDLQLPEAVGVHRASSHL